MDRLGAAHVVLNCWSDLGAAGCSSVHVSVLARITFGYIAERTEDLHRTFRLGETWLTGEGKLPGL